MTMILNIDGSRSCVLMAQDHVNTQIGLGACLFIGLEVAAQKGNKWNKTLKK